jgi:hypothetical protein
LAKYPYKQIGVKFDRNFRNDLNANFTDIGTDTKSVQDQINQVVIDGDSSAEAAQARVDTDGVTHTTLKERLDNEHADHGTQLAQARVDADGFTHTTLQARLNDTDSQLAHIATNLINAIGDGISDDTAAFKSAIAESENKIIILGHGKTYKITDELILKKGTRILANGSKLNFHLSGNKRTLVMNDNTAFLDGEVNVIEVEAATGAGQYQCPILIGDYGVGTGYSNILIENVSISSQRSNANGIFITGDSHNVTINNLKVPSSATLGRPILIHWGGASNPTAGTFHPHNITISNVIMGKMTNTSIDGAAIFVSGAHNILVKNVEAEEVFRSLFTVFAGDYGYDYASTEVKALSLKNIRAENLASKLSRTYGVYVDSQSKLTTIKTIYQTNIVIDQLTSIGDRSSTVNSGIALGYCNGVEIRNSHIEGHVQGLGTAENVKNVKVISPTFIKNRKSGTYISNGTVAPENITIENPICHSNGEFGTGVDEQSGVYVGNGRNCKIIRGLFGIAEEMFQLAGVRLSGSSEVEINDCHVNAVKSGGMGYSLGSGGSYGVVKLFSGNTVGDGITLRTGLNIVPIQNRGILSGQGNGSRVFTGQSAPTSGTWVKGDYIINEMFSELGDIGSKYVLKGLLCVSATGSGTWVEERTLTGN